MKLDKLEKQIKKLSKVVETLTQLALAIGTLISVIKMILTNL